MGWHYFFYCFDTVIQLGYNLIIPVTSKGGVASARCVLPIFLPHILIQVALRVVSLLIFSTPGIVTSMLCRQQYAFLLGKYRLKIVIC
jgi:hypothetical protein